jgi:bacterioferritin-associated ferredoxin
MVVLLDITEHRHELAARRIVCHCFQVSEVAIRQTIDMLGAESVGEVTQHTGAGGGCSACHCRIRRMIDGKPAMCSRMLTCETCGYAPSLCECRVA